jgi:hypothetical protein
LINQKLHLQPRALDTNLHRKLKLKLPLTDWSVAKGLNAIFVAAAEFGDVCREYPIVFIKAGKEDDGSDAIAPVAVFGLTQDDNLYVNGQEWRGQYVPAVLRAYPFCIARVDAERFAICMDQSCAGFSESEGTPLFDDEAKPTDMLKAVSANLENLEGEVQRTRLIGKRLLELDLLREMRFDTTLPDGRQHTVDGFLTVDDKKVTELPEATVMELHRSGILGLIHLHWVSIGNMRRLAGWYTERALGSAAKAPAVAAPAAATV